MSRLDVTVGNYPGLKGIYGRSRSVEQEDGAGGGPGEHPRDFRSVVVVHQVGTGRTKKEIVNVNETLMIQRSPL